MGFLNQIVSVQVLLKHLKIAVFNMNVGHIKCSVFQIVIDIPEIGPSFSNQFEQPIGKILKMIDGVVDAQGAVPTA
jgi:hypothetical protein